MKFRCLSYHIRSAFPLRVCFVKEKSRVKLTKEGGDRKALRNKCDTGEKKRSPTNANHSRYSLLSSQISKIERFTLK